MNRREAYEDVSFLLLYLPFVSAAVFALYLWAEVGFSSFLPEQVFLGVTRNPDLFLLGVLAVLAGTIMEASIEERTKRGERVLQLSRRLQKLAVASFVLAIVTAWYANGFSLGGLSGAGSDLFSGRYTIVFPAVLLFYSFLIVTPLASEGLGGLKTVAIILLLAVPAVIYEVGKRNAPLGLGGALLLTILAGVLLSRGGQPSRSDLGNQPATH